MTGSGLAASHLARRYPAAIRTLAVAEGVWQQATSTEGEDEAEHKTIEVWLE